MTSLLALAGLGQSHELRLFVVAVLVLNATPGVDLLLTVTRTLQGGARAGMAAALGINVGCVLHALAAAFGLAAMLAVSASAFTVLKAAGAAYLLWLAWGMFREAWDGRNPTAPSAPTAPRSAFADFRAGLWTNLLNPKVALFFLAFLPQFIRPEVADKTKAFLVLGAVFVAQSSLFLAVVVALSTRARGLALPAAATRSLKAAGGGLFAALALRLALGTQTKA